MQFADDPWFIALLITMVIMTLLTAYAVRGYIKEWLILAMALPPAIFKKVFGEPKH